MATCVIKHKANVTPSQFYTVNAKKNTGSLHTKKSTIAGGGFNDIRNQFSNFVLTITMRLVVTDFMSNSITVQRVIAYLLCLVKEQVSLLGSDEC